MQLRFRKIGVPRGHDERVAAVLGLIDEAGDAGVHVTRLSSWVVREWGVSRRSVELILLELRDAGYTYMDSGMRLRVNPLKRGEVDSCLAPRT